jgi:hypothetical protein
MEISYVCSLGNKCHSASLIKRNHLKKCSYPFDWIFSSCDNIIHCLNDNFQTFLNKNLYTDIQIRWNDNQCGHLFYHPNMFNHKDPRKDDDYNYYVRCVQRFTQLLTYPEHKLFIMMFPNMDNIDYHIRNNVVDFNNHFLQHTYNYTLLVIFHLPNKSSHYHTFSYQNNIHFLELHTLSESDGSVFYNDIDNHYLDNIIKEKYHFQLK